MFTLGVSVAYAFNFLLASDLTPNFEVPIAIVAPLPLALFRILTLLVIFP